MVIVMFISLPAMTVEQNIYILRILSNETFCSPRKYPSPPRRATEIPRGGGGGAPKGDIFRGDGGCFQRYFSRGLNNIGEFLINNCFYVEHAFSYYTVSGRQNKYYCLH